MLMDAYRDEQSRIRIAYRNDGHLLNSRRRQATTRVPTATGQDLLFMDDCALNTVTEEDMQRSMDLFTAGLADFGSTISTFKTVFMHQPPPCAEYNAPRIDVNGAQLKNVKTFAYLGNTLSRNTRIDDEFAQWISKVSHSIGQLQASVWKHNGIQLNTKLKMYKAVVLTKLLYGVETWTVHSNQARKLNHSHLSCLRRILKLRWQDRIPDPEAGAAIYETNRIAAAKAKSSACKSQAPRINNANSQALPTGLRCQRTFRARIGLVGHLQTQSNYNPTISISATAASDPSMTTTPTNDNNFIDAPPPTITDTILPPPPSASITATNTTCPTPTTSDYLPPATSNTTTATSTSDGDSVLTCPHCDRTFTSRLCLVGHLRMH
ncbi:unnamed protein product [Schistocephalus solidus]|uniref:C2H2-type domain-containing protein n=1 Tax=Schistocephalus solidus TaxID=70667 RepID=A0A183TI02_SCHSO|nr:unnamed protein product [Schistocephalus solidus]